MPIDLWMEAIISVQYFHAWTVFEIKVQTAINSKFFRSFKNFKIASEIE